MLYTMLLSTFVSLITILSSVIQGRPSVNKIIVSENIPLDIKCPDQITALRHDTLKLDSLNKKIITSNVDTIFRCQIFYDTEVKRKGNRLYYVSMIPLFNSSIVGCLKLDSCLKLYLKHDPPNDFIEVHIKSSTPCLYKSLPFRYELRFHNELKLTRDFHVYVGQTPPVPGHLNFNLEGNTLFMTTKLKAICITDLKEVKYYIQQEYSTTNCSKSYESSCQIKLDNNNFSVLCEVNNTCLSQSLCDVQYSAFVYGENKFKMKTNQSPRFISMLALAKARSVSTTILNETLNSIALNFRKPVDCDSPFSTFQYKISYWPEGEHSVVNLIDTSCQRNPSCTVSLTGLESSKKYSICVAHLAYFDQTFNEPYCINASTGSVPCKTPEIQNVSYITTEEKSFSVHITWDSITDRKCWNDKDVQYFSIHLYRRSDGNNVLAQDLPSNLTETLIPNLLYTENYKLKLLSCNVYGCLSGISYRLSVQYYNRKDDGPSKIQRITETVLICILSLLFFIFSAILYVILKKRKQFQRFHRRARTEDIQLVTGCNMIENVKEDNTKQTLLAHKTETLSEQSIPENSTLV